MSSQIERYDQHTNLLREYANRLLALQLNKEWDGSAENLTAKACVWLAEHALSQRDIRIFSWESIPKTVGEYPASEYVGAQLDRRGLSVLSEVEKMLQEVLELQLKDDSAEDKPLDYYSKLELQKQELTAQLEGVKGGASVYILDALPKGLKQYQLKSKSLLVKSNNLRKDLYPHILSLLKVFTRPLPSKYWTLPVMLESSLELWEAGACYYWLTEREMWVMSRPNLESLFIEAAKAEELSAKRQTKIVSKERRSKDDTKRDNTKL